MASATDMWRLPVFRRNCATTRIALVPMASAILAFEPRVLTAACRVNKDDNDFGKLLRSSPPRKFCWHNSIDVATAALVYANGWFAFCVCFDFSHRQQPTIFARANLPRSAEDPMP